MVTHILDYGLRDEAALDDILEKAFGYPLGILDIAFAPWRLLYEIGVHELVRL